MTRLLQGSVFPPEYGIAVWPKQGANSSFYPFLSALSVSLPHIFLVTAFFVASFFFFNSFLRFKRRGKGGITETKAELGRQNVSAIHRKSEPLWNLNECWSSPIIFTSLFPRLSVLPAFPTLSSKWPQKGQLWNRNYLWAEEQKQSFG